MYYQLQTLRLTFNMHRYFPISFDYISSSLLHAVLCRFVLLTWAFNMLIILCRCYRVKAELWVAFEQGGLPAKGCGQGRERAKGLSAHVQKKCWRKGTPDLNLKPSVMVKPVLNPSTCLQRAWAYLQKQC